MQKKKNEDLDMLKQAAQLGGGVAAGAGLKGALNSILSGKESALGRVLPKALGRATGVGAVAASLMPSDISAGATEAERKLEAGEQLSEDEETELQLMKDQARDDMDRSMDEEAAAQRRSEGKRKFNREMLDYDSRPDPTEEEIREKKKEDLLRQLREMGMDS